MNKCHENLNFVNNTTPALNDTNMNYIDGCIDILDNRIVTLDTTKANQSDLLQTVKGITYNTSTGVITVTWWNGNTFTIDLNIEKIPVNFTMSESGVITMTTADGTQYTADISTVLKLYTFVDSDEINFTVTQNGNNYTVTASIVEGSITADKLQPNFLADCEAAQAAAEAAADEAEAKALVSEGWAQGTQGGIPVGPDSPYYEKSAAYYAEATGGTSLAALNDTQISNPEEGEVLTYDETLGKWKNEAGVQFATLPVSNLTAVPSDSQVTLSWTNPEDVVVGGTKVAELELIKVYRDGALVERALMSTFTDTGLVNGQTYVYTVVAETTKGVESAVATISATPVATGLSITLNGAKNDVIAVYNEEDTLIDTITFESGETSGLLVLDNAYIGQTLKFESSVAKGTTDATKTQNYVQRTEITEGMTVINVMPEGALYWYGNEIVSVTGGWRNPNDNLITSDAQEKFDCHGDNGIRTLTKGTNALYTKADDRNASVKRVYATWYTTNTINVAAYSKLKCLTNRIQAQGTTAYRDHFGIVSPDMNNKALGELTISNVWYNSVGAQIMEMAVSEMTITNGYIFSWAIVSNGIIEKNVSAIWLEKSTPVTLTLEGAKEDNITIKQNGTTVATCIFASGATSGTVTLDVPADGSDAEFVFESSVAKDTTSGTSNYTKTVNLNKTSVNVKVMPGESLYWYGNECTSLTGGWGTNYAINDTANPIKSQSEPIKYTHYLETNATLASRAGVSFFATESAIDLSNHSAIAMVAQGISKGASSNYIILYTMTDKTWTTGIREPAINVLCDSTNKEVLKTNYTATDSVYILVGAPSVRRGDCYAIWLE